LKKSLAALRHHTLASSSWPVIAQAAEDGEDSDSLVRIMGDRVVGIWAQRYLQVQAALGDEKDAGSLGYCCSDKLVNLMQVLKIHTPYTANTRIPDSGGGASSAATALWIRPRDVRAAANTAGTVSFQGAYQDAFSYVLQAYAMNKGGVRIGCHILSDLVAVSQGCIQLSFPGTRITTGNTFGSITDTFIQTAASTSYYPTGYTHVSVTNEAGAEINCPYFDQQFSKWTQLIAGQTPDTSIPNMVDENALYVLSSTGGEILINTTRAVADDFTAGPWICAPSAYDASFVFYNEGTDIAT